MSQTVKKESKATEPTAVPTNSEDELDLGNYLFLSHEDEEKLVDTILKPPDFNDALLRAKESYNHLFKKEI